MAWTIRSAAVALWHRVAVASGRLAWEGETADPGPSGTGYRSRHGRKRPDAWKKAMREPNAIGWIAFLILMAGIGVGAILFDRGDESGMSNGPCHRPSWRNSANSGWQTGVWSVPYLAMFHVKHSGGLDFFDRLSRLRYKAA